MQVEIEAKLKVDSLQEITEKLDGLGAEFLEEQMKQKALSSKKVIAAMADKTLRRLLLSNRGLVNIVI